MLIVPERCYGQVRRGRLGGKPSSGRARRVVAAVLALLAGVVAAGCQQRSAVEPSIKPEPRSRPNAKPVRAKTVARSPLLVNGPLQAPPAPTGCESPDPTDASPKTSTRPQEGRLVPVQGKQDESLANAIRLEYERECYKQAEARVREQLIRLQASIRPTNGPARRRIGDR